LKMNLKPTTHSFSASVSALVVLAALFHLTPISAAESKEKFQGSVKMQIEEGRNTHTVDYHVKGDRMRIEGIGEMGGAMIMNMGEREMIMLMEDQRMYMRMPIPAEAAAHAEPGAETEPHIERTGDTREILGYQARRYLVRDGDRRMEVWGTEELKPLAMLQMPEEQPGRPSTPQASALDEVDFFPLMVEERDERGRVVSRMEVMAVDERNLPDTLFAPPAGYQSFQMPTLPDFEMPRP